VNQSGAGWIKALPDFRFRLWFLFCETLLRNSGRQQGKAVAVL
jgi:hypothetical protein